MDILLEERERQSIHYYCIASDHHRYDLSIIYSEKFFGKAMVVSIQSGQMVLMCDEDIENDMCWAEKLGIELIDIRELKSFFHLILQNRQVANQY
ncbi:DUF3055 domain-containing protein [Pseudalkalibacillus decolorationis]|uniref:DUF3055 domain-containing protein n=1 Tax=Pseudalkalibacillus decolorationis TaxID=163879 RepID=UPI0021498E01